MCELGEYSVWLEDGVEGLNIGSYLLGPRVSLVVRHRAGIG